ncbi:hypothetical protein [Nocardia sp. CNY236]|uniref:hypothetical protein n=1 Tax=Nocardia sp. CNY236 TaxID=1169152 RepID=UPI000491D108|nr:hypothetical protein [Nocardia sp. CNY236]
MTTVLVLGGYGAVGAHLMVELHAMGANAIAAGRDSARTDRMVDVTEPGLESYIAALADVDVVVNASGVEDPRLAEIAGRCGAAFIDITATTAYIAELRRLESAAPVLVDVGLAPGLTNLLAAAVYRVSPGPIDLVVLLGAGERHGAAGTAWAYRLLGGHFPDGARAIRNYTEPKTFDLPGHRRRRLYRVDFSDQHSLRRDLETPVRTYFGLDSAAATTALAIATWLPGASSVTWRPHLAGADDWLVLAYGHDGTIRRARGRVQSRATSIVAATAATVAPRLPAGVHHLHRVLDLDDLPTTRGIDID